MPGKPSLRFFYLAMKNFYYLKGLSDEHLIDLFAEVKKALKYRKLLKHRGDDDGSVVITERLLTNRKIKEKKHRIKYHEIDEIGDPYTCPIYVNNKQTMFFKFFHDDWTHFFQYADNEKRNYYVYYHTDITKDDISFSRDKYEESVKFVGLPFYIGKGTGDRYLNLHSRNSAHRKRIEALNKIGIEKDKICFKLFENLTEREAFALESKLISFLGSTNEIPRSVRYFTGFNGGLLINSDVPPRPKWVEILIQRLSKTLILR